ncbi:NAD(P)-dependent oxidoreductase [Bartonella doshiae]|uniref:Glyoxylate/hydroxypyruvate reductase B n=2 Tax=Bartonella doshiae TaxID=33044 RepID=A0A380ZGD4_BARDO|nr:NAD(P)-dependent oxidoreductase [Bartonella doshiae]EJF79637.1 hypothetical protein MCS_01364 [Bartonella doshiae NCTC 12862 = ATCC 700133]MBB6160080.1 lactate dehydrogenase-like 2-hydroxyacid dehydrogenase [Bartonella doshiae]SUV45394.1 Glyoxylate/hydroxypyruvate reductase B [Bartonella doshiae]
MKVLVSGIEVPTEILNYVNLCNGQILTLTGEKSKEELDQILPSTNFYLLGGNEYLDHELLDKATELKAIVVLAAGASSFVDIEAANERGITVLNTPGANALAVAEFAVAQMLATRRNLIGSVLNSMVRCRSQEVTNSRIGILGLGAIGYQVARILRSGFNCDVSYTSRSRKLDVEEKLKITYVSLEELFNTTSTVIVCCDLNAQTEGLIGSSLFGRKARTIVGISDIRVFDILSIINNLKDGHLDAVTLDVSLDLFSSCLPSKINRKELSYHGLYVTPHIAANSHEAWARMIVMGTDKLLQSMDSKENHYARKYYKGPETA